jgi:hypothetical protein
MNSLKDHVRKAHPTINHFLTYADNYAVGYFKKQGFTKEISLDRSKWVGYIKDYEGGTIMQCTMLPVVRYMEVHQMLADQKAVSLRDRSPGETLLTKGCAGEDTHYISEPCGPAGSAGIQRPKRRTGDKVIQGRRTRFG